MESKPVFWRLSYKRMAQAVFALFLVLSGLAYRRFHLEGFESPVGLVLAGGAVALLVSSFCFWKEQRAIAGHVFATTVLLGSTFAGLLSSGLSSELMYWLPFIPLMATFFVGLRPAAVYTLLTIAAVQVIGAGDFSHLLRMIALTTTTLFAFALSAFSEMNRKTMEEKLSTLASLHPLTGLPSRAVFDLSFNQLIARCKRYEETFGVIFLDVDGLKPVNDRLGHGGGDALLVEVARRLQDVTRQEELPFHLSGDEFVILAYQVDDESVKALLERIREIEKKALVLGAETLAVSVSLGVAIGSGDSEPGKLLAQADAAMYEDKVARKGSAARR